MSRAFLALSTLSACDLTGPTGDDLDAEDIEMTVETALDDLDAEAGARVATSLVVDDPSVGTDEDSRREMIKEILVEMAQAEPCPVRGLVGGLYEEAGTFAGRAWKRDRTLVARGEGTHAPGEVGGTFDGVYDDIEGDEGIVAGEYLPAAEHPAGTFDGSWAPTADDGAGGDLAGLWHPLEDGRGLWLGYWTRCEG